MKSFGGRRAIIASCIALVVIALSSALIVLSKQRISPEAAQHLAREELILMTRHLAIEEGSLIGPVAVRESGNEFYFTWAGRDHPERAAVIVWVSSRGETDATIVDAEIMKNYQKKYENESR